MPSEHRLVYSRAVALSLMIAALMVPLGLWAQQIDVGPGIVPIYDAEGRSFWLAGLLVATIGGVFFQFLDQDQAYALATARERGIRYEAISELPTAWIYPSVTTFGVVMLLAIYHSVMAIAGCALLAFLLLLGGTVARHHLFDVSEMARSRARSAYTILIHVVAFITLSMVYINKVRSLFSATAVLLIAFLLLLQMTDGEDTLFSRRLVYAIVGGVMLGQITWVLNYWRATGWTGGAALLIFFYLAAGLIATQLRDRVAYRDLLEYGSVATVAFGIVVYSLFM